MRLITRKMLVFYFMVSTASLSCVELQESYSLRDLVAAINIHIPITSESTKNLSLKDIAAASNFCDLVNLLDYMITITSYSLAAFLPFFGDSLGGDILTGNPFVEGSNEETLVTITLSKSLRTLHHVSLDELQEIFRHLREDLTKRARYLDHRNDKNEILKILHDREKRLLDNLHMVEKCVFHFREHTELSRIQHKFAITVIVLTPFIIGLLFCASFDTETQSLHLPTENRLCQTLAFLNKKLTA